VLKWLCGGPGVAYLYVRPDLAAKLEPKLTGWIAHQSPFAFEVGAQRYTSGAYRFMTGTPNIPALYFARPGLQMIGEIGVERIRQKSKQQTARLIALADQRGWRVNTPRDPERRGGTVSIDMPNSREVCAELIARNILVDFRPKAGVRMSPHFYNTDEELEVAMSAVRPRLSRPVGQYFSRSARGWVNASVFAHFPTAGSCLPTTDCSPSLLPLALRSGVCCPHRQPSRERSAFPVSERCL
jgi:kynureninase